MTKHGEFDTDASALLQRIKSHEKYGSTDLNTWMFSHLILTKGLKILEIGSGTGRQSVPMAEIVGKNGHILSVDISQEALNVLLTSASLQGLNKQITTLCSDFDDLATHLQGKCFDRVVSSYALYYSKDSVKIFNTISRALNARGVLFFCGPREGNNSELKSFHYNLKNMPIPPETKAVSFMEDTGQSLAREFFGNVEIFRFDNPIRFNSADAMYNYWRSYNLFDAELEAQFKFAVSEYFRTNSIFETVKRVMGVRAIK